MQRGKLISIEGSDGSGKNTQTNLLVERLNKEGIICVKSGYPRYNTPTGKIVGGPFLGKPEIGESFFKNPSKVDAITAAYYYAADRRDAHKDIIHTLKSGINLIMDRYVESSMAHQGGKAKTLQERKRIIKKIGKMEYGLSEMPRPDKTIFLYMPYDVVTKLIKEKDKVESDEEYLRNSEDVFLYMAKKLR